MGQYVNTSIYQDEWRLPTLNKPIQLDKKLYKELYDQNLVWKVNLDTRKITGPNTLMCQDDHNAELILFEVDRYFGTLDLADTCCVVQFKTKTPTGEDFLGIYPVRFYDVLTCEIEGKILIPWSISRAVTQTANTVEFNLRFYLVDYDDEATGTNPRLEFNLNTLSTYFTIAKTLSIQNDQIDNAYNNVEQLFKEDLSNYNYEALHQLLSIDYKNNQLYWEDAGEN